MSNLDGVNLKVIKFVQELIADGTERTKITPTLISEKIDQVLQFQPAWNEGFSRQLVTEELIRRSSVWIGKDTTLKSDVGHVSWLNAARKNDWRYWQRYREWIETRLSGAAADALDRSTDAILGLLEDPKRDGVWDRRGLVVGHVQSGKTGSYTGLINKAADAGYKIIVVLAGLHNNLRSQTQMRLDEGFLGYETSPVIEDVRIIGVGEIDGDPAIRPNYATNRAENGDFNTKISKHLGITPEARPWLFVVKKNKTVLERLLKWLTEHVATSRDESGRKRVSHLPLLLIDDEADHASVDTGEQLRDEDGKPDEDHQPTAINRCTRRILHLFDRSAYVGYTATPFANIFIHERGETKAEGPDLFPAAFIINLAASSNYIGPTRVFGLATPEGRIGGLPLIRSNEDHGPLKDEPGPGWMPVKHKNGHAPRYQGSNELPPSLHQAIQSFLLVCAERKLRNQGQEHCSMLVHVTRFTNVQDEVYRQVDSALSRMRQRLVRKIDDQELIESLKLLWNEDFAKTSRQISDQHPDLETPPASSWDDIRRILSETIEDIQIRKINGTAKDALDYADQSGQGLKVIAIGGDKLSRGLTLEGLTVSYFLRASKMYDTLMQMGRWFGYRPGYADLCRLYITRELSEWFGHIADAANELREEFEVMAASGATPREYGLKVQSHSVLMVTSPLKMRSAKNLMLSFSGQVLETVVFYKDPARRKQNVGAATELLSTLGGPEIDPVRIRDGSRQQWTGYLWKDIPAANVIDFLRSYVSHPNAYKVNSALLAEFIDSMRKVGELVDWTVAFIGGGKGEPFALVPGLEVTSVQRANESSVSEVYTIGRLLSPRDESIDMSEGAWSAAMRLTLASWQADPGRSPDRQPPDMPNGTSLRKVRGFGDPDSGVQPTRGTGLLMLYLLDPSYTGPNHDQAGHDIPFVGFGISFPSSEQGLKVEYKVNNVLWELEYGPGE